MQLFGKDTNATKTPCNSVKKRGNIELQETSHLAVVPGRCITIQPRYKSDMTQCPSLKRKHRNNNNSLCITLSHMACVRTPTISALQNMQISALNNNKYVPSRRRATVLIPAAAFGGAAGPLSHRWAHARSSSLASISTRGAPNMCTRAGVSSFPRRPSVRQQVRVGSAPMGVHALKGAAGVGVHA